MHTFGLHLQPAAKKFVLYIPIFIQYNIFSYPQIQKTGENNMSKQQITRIIAFLLVLGLVLSIVPLAAMADETDGVVIKLHYHRPDGLYDDWSVWFWNYGQEGTDIPFYEENGEMVATFPVKAGVTQVGFIVKLPNWAAKDVNEDQFIDVAAYVSGTVHVYVEAGVKGYTTQLSDDVASGIKVKDASYRSNQGVVVAMTAEIDPSELTLMGPDGAVTLSNTFKNGSKYTLVPETELDLYADYTILYNGEEYPVTMPNVYSTEAFEEAYTYTGSDLGATWTAEKTTFRVWAPTATAVKVNLYEAGDPANSDLIRQVDMTADVNGTWVATVEGDLNGTYYTYQVDVDGQSNEACDPYARTTGVNGARAMVIDLDSTDPEGWENDVDPHYDGAITDAVIYELHVRDLSVDAGSGIQNQGKYLGLIETGTTTPDGIPTGLDHIKNLGVTHIHLLPVYDYGSVDETKLDMAQFNWGYDPVNYNVPEGSYATDPYNGAVRVSEFKQMVKGLHDNGISVVMDVVYNHVYNGGAFCFNKIVPGYFSRITDSGVYSNGSGCGNDTASERAMVKKYIVDSVCYWADEYHIDGFRFDLVGLIDTETINEVIEEVHKTHPNVIFYGEGWTMTTQVTKDGYTMTTQVNSRSVPEFAFFSDTIRDALKGSVFDSASTGYVSGQGISANTIASSFLGKASWCHSPTQTINYASCHDNNTLFDRIVMSTSGSTTADQIKMNNLAAAIYMTSQGVPFIHAGEEMLRSKPLENGGFDHNSYSSSDAVNSLKWNDLSSAEYQQVYSYYQGLIAFRKAHAALRMTDAAEVAEKITQIPCISDKVLAFHIAAGANGENNELFVIFNPLTDAVNVDLPAGDWTVYISGDKAGVEALATASGTVTAEAISAVVLVKPGEAQSPAVEGEDPTTGTLPSGTEVESPEEANTITPAAIIGALLGFAVGVVVTTAFFLIRMRKTLSKKENEIQ